ncbi:hypothetical protein AMTR_s00044p00124390 [Amborella trichopoda]|uniref:X8 domain-containing protein n=1 Tax=Amborella trichopoda TaxID=13333 RepID=U5D3X6_AMBTC|nr:hypothetical protein AMTR_s00044p00124390 [Amborella trichopoda]
MWSRSTNSKGKVSGIMTLTFLFLAVVEATDHYCIARYGVPDVALKEIIAQLCATGQVECDPDVALKETIAQHCATGQVECHPVKAEGPCGSLENLYLFASFIQNEHFITYANYNDTYNGIELITNVNPTPYY